MYGYLTAHEAIAVENKVEHLVLVPSELANVLNEMDSRETAMMCETLARLFDERSVINSHKGARDDLRSLFIAVARKMETRCALAEKRAMQEAA